MTNNYIYFVANWKMHGNLRSLKSVKHVINLLKIKKFRNIRVVYCPPFTLLNEFVNKTKKSKIDVGAQNINSSKNYGPFTGQINAIMIKDIGCKYVILGHSENRNSGEKDILINYKLKSALDKKLKVILCVGEKSSDKKKGKTFNVLKKQINKGLSKVKYSNRLFVAYEPVWSIGTGIIPNTEYLQKQIKNIKMILNKKFNKKNVKILYGGSVNSENIKFLTKINQINGYLVGGSSLKSKKFIDIIKKTIN